MNEREYSGLHGVTGSMALCARPESGVQSHHAKRTKPPNLHCGDESPLIPAEKASPRPALLPTPEGEYGEGACVLWPPPPAPWCRARLPRLQPVSAAKQKKEITKPAGWTEFTSLRTYVHVNIFARRIYSVLIPPAAVQVWCGTMGASFTYKL